MTIASKLTELNTVKGEIHDAIEAKGVSLTGVEFRDYATKIAEIEGGGEASWSRPSDWPEVTTWVTGAPQRITALMAVGESSGGNKAQVYVTLSTGTYTIDWGDGVIETSRASNTNYQHTYDYSDVDLIPGDDGIKYAVIKISTSGGNITAFNAAQASLGQQMASILEYQFNTPNCNSLTLTSSNAYSYYLKSLVIHAMGTANPTLVNNITRDGLQNVEITSDSMTSFPAAGLPSMRRYIVNSTVTGAVTLGSLSSGNGTFPFGGVEVEYNLATNSNFACPTINGAKSLRTFTINNAGTGKVSALNFAECSALKSVVLPGTVGTISNQQVFDACSSLEKVEGLQGATFTNMVAFWRRCNSLTTLPVYTCTATNGTACFQESTGIRYIPNINFSNVTTTTSMFEGYALCRFQGTLNAATSVSFANNMLGPTELNEIYTNLPVASGSPTITVSGNPGTSGDNPSIATAKGWTVSGS